MAAVSAHFAALQAVPTGACLGEVQQRRRYRHSRRASSYHRRAHRLALLAVARQLLSPARSLLADVAAGSLQQAQLGPVVHTRLVGASLDPRTLQAHLPADHSGVGSFQIQIQPGSHRTAVLVHLGAPYRRKVDGLQDFRIQSLPCWVPGRSREPSHAHGQSAACLQRDRA